MIVAQVIDAVIAARLNRDPGASSPNDAALSPAVPTLRIVGTVGESEAADNPSPARPRYAGKAWSPARGCLTEAAMRHGERTAAWPAAMPARHGAVAGFGFRNRAGSY
jgi:hypothetical protein